MTEDKYNTKLSQLSGVVTSYISEISNDNELLKGEKFLLMQRFIADITPSLKIIEKLENEIKEFAKANISHRTEYTGLRLRITPKAPVIRNPANK
jgi:hypothetical protein